MHVFDSILSSLTILIQILSLFLFSFEADLLFTKSEENTLAAQRYQIVRRIGEGSFAHVIIIFYKLVIMQSRDIHSYTFIFGIDNTFMAI